MAPDVQFTIQSFGGTPKIVQQLQADNTNFQQPYVFIKGALKIKENGLTHGLGEDNPIVETILREEWLRGPAKTINTHSVAES